MKTSARADDSIEMRIAQRIRSLRTERQWPLEELASRSGVSRASLSRIENGEVSPTAAVLCKLCAAFGLTLSEIVNDIAGGTATGRPVKAVQIGGPLGAYFPVSKFDTPFGYEEYDAQGGLIGHAGIVVRSPAMNSKAARISLDVPTSSPPAPGGSVTRVSQAGAGVNVAAAYTANNSGTNA